MADSLADLRKQLEQLQREVNDLARRQKELVSAAAKPVVAPSPASPKSVDPKPKQAAVAMPSEAAKASVVDAPETIQPAPIVALPKPAPTVHLSPVETPKPIPKPMPAVASAGEKELMRRPGKPANRQIRAADRSHPPALSTDRPIYDLQRMLNALGYHAGEEDGKRGSGTSAAIGRFVEKYNAGVDKQEFPQNMWKKLDVSASVQDLLTAARAELVEKTLSRIEGQKAYEEQHGGGYNRGMVEPIQRNLKLLDFYNGPENGKPDAALRQAMEAFKHNPYRDHLSWLDPKGIGHLTGRNYEKGNDNHPVLRHHSDKKHGAYSEQRYLKTKEFTPFDMPVESLRPYANKEGWVVWKKPADWGITKNGQSSFSVGHMGAYNVNTGEHYDFGGGRTTIPYMAGGAGNVHNSRNEWQKNAATPGDVQVDFLPGDPNLTAAEQVKSSNSHHRFGFFTWVSNGYADKGRDDDIGFHPDVGSIGSHGCPNVQKKNPETKKADADDVKKMFRKLHPSHVVTIDADISIYQGRDAKRDKSEDKPEKAKPEKHSALTDDAHRQVAQISRENDSVSGGRQVAEAESPVPTPEMRRERGAEQSRHA